MNPQLGNSRAHLKNTTFSKSPIYQLQEKHFEEKRSKKLVFKSEPKFWKYTVYQRVWNNTKIIFWRRHFRGNMTLISIEKMCCPKAVTFNPSKSNAFETPGKLSKHRSHISGEGCMLQCFFTKFPVDFHGQPGLRPAAPQHQKPGLI